MEIHVLDCTLSQGIKFKNNQLLLHSLCNVGNLMIEVGEMSSESAVGINLSRIFDTENMHDQCEKKKFSILLDINDYDDNNIPKACDSVNVVRLLFEKNRINALRDIVNDLKKKDYEVFLCPKESLTYSDMEWLDLIEIINKVSPEAVYIYDKRENSFKCYDDYNRMFLLLDSNLNDGIMIGIHIGDKFSTSFGMIEKVCSNITNRGVVVDTSILGFGDGKEYPNTELILEHMNIEYSEKYLYDSMEMMLPLVKQPVPWGYSPLSFLSAKTMVDIEYFAYYYTKGLHLIEMKNIVELIDDDQYRYEFDKDYADKLLEAWQKRFQYIYYP